MALTCDKKKKEEVDSLSVNFCSSVNNELSTDEVYLSSEYNLETWQEINMKNFNQKLEN